MMKKGARNTGAVKRLREIHVLIEKGAAYVYLKICYYKRREVTILAAYIPF